MPHVYLPQSEMSVANPVWNPAQTCCEPVLAPVVQTPELHHFWWLRGDSAQSTASRSAGSWGKKDEGSVLCNHFSKDRGSILNYSEVYNQVEIEGRQNQTTQLKKHPSITLIIQNELGHFHGSPSHFAWIFHLSSLVLLFYTLIFSFSLLYKCFFLSTFPPPVFCLRLPIPSASLFLIDFHCISIHSCHNIDTGIWNACLCLCVTSTWALYSWNTS